MPATYTYNDALDDAKGAVMASFDEGCGGFSGSADEDLIDLLLLIGRKIDALKRPSRRKREMSSDAGQQGG